MPDIDTGWAGTGSPPISSHEDMDILCFFLKRKYFSYLTHEYMNQIVNHIWKAYHTHLAHIFDAYRITHL